MKYFLTFLFVVLGVCANAQEFRATITGRVTDSTGAVVQNARITVTNTATGVATTTKSDGVGQYAVPFLLPGQYSITADAAGFERYERSGITLQAGDKLGIDVPLKVGNQTQQITVTADAALIETASSTSGEVLAPVEIDNLPDNGRSPMALAKTDLSTIRRSVTSPLAAAPRNRTSTC